MKIAYITYSGVPKYSPANNFSEVTDLIPFLQNKGLDIHAEIWDDPTVDWNIYDLAVLKTPWDYHRKLDSFRLWLDKMESFNIRMLNPYQTIRWNLNKYYLKEISDAGLDIIPSIFLSRDWTEELDTLFEKLESNKLIVKPCVSGGSENTFVINKNYSIEQRDNIIRLAAGADLIVQPFLEEIKEGEWSFIFFNGVYSHTIIKKPKTGDFRVQQAFGGTIETVFPELKLIEKAKLYVSGFAKETLYARVDGVIVNGEFKLMELELIEPFLYLSYNIDSIERYYQALIKHFPVINKQGHCE